jgi:cytochrome c oxidase subunit II
MATEEAKATTGSRERAHERAHVWPLVVIGVVASAIGIAIGLAIHWFPTQASKEGAKIDTLWDVLIIFSVPVFVLVEVVVLYSVWRFRMRPGEELDDGPPIHGNTRLEIVWTALPAIVLVALCSYAYITLTDIEEADANALNVRVVGEQFTWTFYYRDPQSGRPVASPQLYVPNGQQVHFTVQSKDVIHDFFIPAFRLKIDAVPGIDTSYRATPKRNGDYPIVCAELCGIGHSAMRQTAHVVEPAAFKKWLNDRATGGTGGGTGGSPAKVDGKQVFMKAGCGSCHALADAGTAGGVGPNLDEGLKGKDEAFIRKSIEDPNADITPGFQPDIMPPNFKDQLQPAELDALVKYLAGVTK